MCPQEGFLPRSKRVHASLVLALFVTGLLVLAPGTAWSQVLYGSIVGNVKDASGAAVPARGYHHHQQGNGQVRTATTNDEGGYSVSTVQSGTYDVKRPRRASGRWSETNVVVTINNISRVDFTMQVGSVSETVEVSAQAQTLQTDRAEVRAEITTKTLTDVPVPGQRNYQALFVTVPGIAHERDAAFGGLQPFPVDVVEYQRRESGREQHADRRRERDQCLAAAYRFLCSGAGIH